MKKIDNNQVLDELFSRGVGEFIDPNGSFRKKLEAKINGEYKQDIIVKLGADPTRPDLHLGHAVVLRKLRILQDLGCKVVFIIGDFTASIGDPTGKNKTRPETSTNKEINNTSSVLSASTHNISGSIDKKQETVISEIPSNVEIAQNMATYTEQIKKILDTSPANFSWIKNSDWFFSTTDMLYGSEVKAGIDVDINEKGKNKKISINIDPNSFLGKTILFEKTRMQTTINPKQITLVTLRGLLWTLKNITHSKLVGRDMFQERIKNNEELFMHEMLYPVIQGIDSYALARIYGSCDMEVGGTDQTFNMLMGRDVMKVNQIEPQAVMSFQVLEGLDGRDKMSKSLDNYIGITDTPNDMYGKVMSIPDSSIGNYFELCTFTAMDEIKEIKQGLADGSMHPKKIKMNLAKQIVAIYHGEKEAVKAEENFVNTFQKGEIPEEMTELEIGIGESIMDLLVKNKIVASKMEFRRLVEEGAITDLSTNKKIDEVNIKGVSGMKLKIGKRRFVKIK